MTASVSFNRLELLPIMKLVRGFKADLHALSMRTMARSSPLMIHMLGYRLVGFYRSGLLPVISSGRSQRLPISGRLCMVCFLFFLTPAELEYAQYRPLLFLPRASPGLWSRL